jgi:hypothetical protein
LIRQQCQAKTGYTLGILFAPELCQQDFDITVTGARLQIFIASKFVKTFSGLLAQNTEIQDFFQVLKIETDSPP